MPATLPESNAAFEQQTADLIDHCRPPNDPALTYPVQRLHIQLVVCLDRNKAHRRSPDCFGNRLGINEIALVGLHVRLYVLRRDDAHFMPLLSKSSP